MLEIIKSVGGWLQSLRGWMFGIAAIPAVVTLATSLLEPLSWTHRVLCVLAAIAFGLVIACAGLVLFRLSSEHFASRREQRRISTQLKEVIESGVVDLDTPTIAAIWSGSRDDADVFRHLKFRSLKAAMRRGDIKWNRRPDEMEPSIRSSLQVVDLVDYFVRKRIIRESDIKV